MILCAFLYVCYRPVRVFTKREKDDGWGLGEKGEGVEGG